MGRRLELQSKLEDILGSKNVYHQPPENMKLKYPCIVYEEHVSTPIKANNEDYIDAEEWDVTLIRSFQDRDKTSEIQKKIRRKFTYCRWAAHFITDGLIHDVYHLYY